MDTYKMALIQMNSVFCDVERNVSYAEAKIREARANGAVFACLPEGFITGYHCVQIDKMLAYAEPADGPAIARFQKLAGELEMFLAVPFFESSHDGTYRNSVVLIDDAGKIAGKHSKCHLVGDEPKYFKHGSEYNVFNTKYGKIGLLICYDICFPEAARILALKGADVIICLAAWRNLSFYLDWYLKVLPARALDNTVYIAGCGMCGEDIPESPFTGSSMFVDPAGKTLAKAGITEETIVYQHLDLAVIPKIRAENTCLIDRHPEDYSMICEKL